MRYSYSHFTGEEPEAQRIYVTCPRSKKLTGTMLDVFQSYQGARHDLAHIGTPDILFIPSFNRCLCSTNIGHLQRAKHMVFSVLGMEQ